MHVDVFGLFRRDRRKYLCRLQDLVGQPTRLSRVEKVQSSVDGTTL